MDTKERLSVEKSIHLSIGKMTTNVYITRYLYGHPANSLNIINQRALECQQVYLARLPSDHDPEADSMLGRGGRNSHIIYKIINMEERIIKQP